MRMFPKLLLLTLNTETKYLSIKIFAAPIFLIFVSENYPVLRIIPAVVEAYFNDHSSPCTVQICN
jgi:hypothetical protein